MPTQKDRMLRQCVRIQKHLADCEPVFLGIDAWRRAQKELDHLVAIIVGESKNADDDIRAEITGRSTKSSKGCFGNTGFSGGCTPAAA